MSQSEIFSVIVAWAYVLAYDQATITENISLWEGVVVLEGHCIVTSVSSDTVDSNTSSCFKKILFYNLSV